MKRKSKLAHTLPPFRISVAELEVLLSRLAPLFGAKDVSWSVDVKLGSEEIDFKNLEEIPACEELPSSVDSFDLWMVGDEKIFWLRSGAGGGIFSSLGEISAQGGNAAWCAGAIEIARRFIESHRRWYGWCWRWPVGAGVLVLLNVPFLVSLPPLSSLGQSIPFAISWIALLAVFFALYLARWKLLPPAILQIRPTESLLRRYLPELTFAASLLALVMTAIGWFFG